MYASSNSLKIQGQFSVFSMLPQYATGTKTDKSRAAEKKKAMKSTLLSVSVLTAIFQVNLV